jgi:hypothetical protein
MLSATLYDGRGYWLCLRRFSRGTIRWWPNADKPLHALQAQELAVLLYNGLPDRADFADEWRSIDPAVFNQAARAGASSSPSARG